jgi:hypothetical protein
MATITWPNLPTGAVDYGVDFDVQISIYRNGKITTFGLPGARWTCSIRFENDFEDRYRPATEALIMSLKGGANRLSLHHLGRPVPNGSLRGNPTLGSAVVAGAEQITIANANGTLKKGDIIGLPGQFVMVLADATPLFSNLTVQVAPAIRAAHNSGTPVVWNKPATLWIPRGASAGPFPYLSAKLRPPFSIDLVEAYV